MTDDASVAAEALLRANDAIAVGDADTAVANLSSAIRHFTTAGQPCDAAMACVRLGDLLGNFLGNLTAARAWFLRAERLVADLPHCLEQGWVAVAAMGCDVDDPADLLRRAELALDRARRFGDVNLETKALADAGLAHVQAGRVDNGMALLDEAMALACGGADDVDATGKSICSFFTACYFAADFERATTWSDSLRHRGLIGTGAPAPLFLSSHCDSVQATLLVEIGRWTEAETLLAKAILEFETALSMPSWHPAIALADLRIRQGRLADAEVLLLGKDGHLQALLPAARLHLARGDFNLATALARRGLRLVGDDRMRAPELLDVLVESHLGRGDVAAATAVSVEMLERTKSLDHPALLARVAAAQARVLDAAGDADGAIAALQGAVDRIAATAAPVLQLELLLRLAGLHERRGASAEALIEARAAASILHQLDVVIDADKVALLRRLGVDGPVAAPRSESARHAAATLRLVDRRAEVLYDNVRAPLPITKGLRYLADLVANPGVERHALDLVDRVEGVDETLNRRNLGNAGPVLDGAARSAYRARIEALRGEVDDALAAGNDGLAMQKQEELDTFVSELAAAFGLGGRERQVGSVPEKARLNVTRALRAAIGKIAEVVPDAGAALDRDVRTGLYCAYEPAADVRWIVQS